MKLTNSDSNKIGIAAEGLRSSAFRKLAQEELKFSNTVVASGLDLLMIGTTSGRQKRERKVPSRYVSQCKNSRIFLHSRLFFVKSILHTLGIKTRTPSLIQVLACRQPMPKRLRLL